MSGAARLPLPEAGGREPSAALTAMRRGMAEAASKGMWATAPPAEELDIAGVRVLRHAAARSARAAVVHFHGGGYRMGMPEAVGPYARRLADTCAVDVYCPAYRLAPDHPFPAGVNDGWAVASALAARYPAGLILAGDSAGGGLAASLAAACGMAGLRLAGLILHSPWLDLTVTSPSYAANADSDPLFSRSAAQEASELYLQGRHPAEDPQVSPLFADPAAFPPTLITVGTGEVLRDDARAMHDRMHAADTDVRLLQIADMEHVAVTRGFDLTGSAESLAATQAFLAELLAR